MARAQNSRLGIWLMITACAVFAVQDAMSRHLAEAANVYMIVAIRFWVMAVVVIVLAARGQGGLRAAARSSRPLLQILRGVLLISEIVVTVEAFVKLGLIETHAVFVCYPLLATMLSVIVLGERVGWRRWLAVLVGFAGVLVILRPGGQIFSWWSLVPFAAALMFALYGVLTRLAGQSDPASVSFFWLGTVGAVVITPFGLYWWQELSPGDWALMAVLCVAAMLSHWLLIRAYEVAEASEIQPFAYFQLPFVALLGFVLFSETLRPEVPVGAAMVVGAGLFTFWRQRVRERQLALARHGDAAAAGPAGTGE